MHAQRSLAAIDDKQFWGVDAAFVSDLRSALGRSGMTSTIECQGLVVFLGGGLGVAVFKKRMQRPNFGDVTRSGCHLSATSYECDVSGKCDDCREA